MKTIIQKIKRDNFTSKDLEQASDIIKRGGLVAFPTETVYGLGADALNKDAAKKIYEAKGRPSDNPLIVHISNIEQLKYIVKEVPSKAIKLAEQFWPGPLTMIFYKSDKVPKGTTGGLETVAVRMPEDLLALNLIEKSNCYIAAPSANTSGRPSPTMAEHVIEDLNGKVDMIIDGGAVSIGVESTIIDLTEDIPMILRPGAITKSMIEKVIGSIEIDSAIIAPDSKSAPKAPGMKYKHYAPKGEVTIVEGNINHVIEKINYLAKEKETLGYKVGIIATEETKMKYTGGVIKSIGTRREDKTIAQKLFSILRELDELEVEYIYTESFNNEELGQAIMNRLRKAAAQRIIYAD